MPGLDLSQVSSNWKELQNTLQTKQKPGQSRPTTSHGVKRKRGEDTGGNRASTQGRQKTRLSLERGKPAAQSLRAMGGSLSTRAELEAGPAAPSQPRGEDPSAGPIADDSITTSQHKVGRYVALDCEMVGTGPYPHSDDVLARASLVNFHGEAVYDAYAQAPPHIRVTDFRRAITGIAPAQMQPAAGAKPFDQVRREIADLLRGRVLVGHALKHDLAVLQLRHPLSDTRDTARHPPFRLANGGKPPALRDLARRELGWEIQVAAHSSVEDARAAMMVFQQRKQAFEEENRKLFGDPRQRRRERPGPDVTVERLSAEMGDEDEDEDRFSDEETAEPSGRTTAPRNKAKKRKKTKKRTKRK